MDQHCKKPSVLCPQPLGDDVIPGCVLVTLTNCQNWSGSSAPRTSRSARQHTQGLHASAQPLKPHTHIHKLMRAHTSVHFICKHAGKVFTQRHSSTHNTIWIMHCTSLLLLCLCQSRRTRGSKYNRSTTVSPGPKWPTSDLREDSSQKLRRHRNIPINLQPLIYLYVFLLARDVS